VKAVVLVGGEGTRLRPLTETIPKPLIPLVDRPFLHHVLDHLAAHGVHEVILSSSYLEASFAAFIRERRGDPSITWITETTPLGTAGAIANAAAEGHCDETFLVCNGDILTDLDLRSLVTFHHHRGAEATIALTPVADARPFGLVARDPASRVLEFREKPAEEVPGEINAWTYVLEPSAVAGVGSDRPVSIEREVFPGLIAAGRPVFASVSDAYWIDLGTPEKYLQATFDALAGRVDGLAYPAPWVSPDADADGSARLGRCVVVGPKAAVGPGAAVEDSVLLEGAVVGPGAEVRGSILGPWSIVGERARVATTVLAERAGVAAGVRCDGQRVGAGHLLDR
jgi:mannose-1-phosphate guanylyltransferase